MSTSAIPIPDRGVPEPTSLITARPVRRRGTLEQGRALESLGHAVEYLIDSSLFAAGVYNQRDEQEAVQILMRSSRAVFAECAEVVSMRRRMRVWVSERLSRRDASAIHGQRGAG